MTHHLPELNKKTLKIILIILFFIFSFTLLRFFFDLRHGPPKDWLDKTFAGKVSKIENNFLTVVDKRGLEKTFLISSSTNFYLGKKLVEVGNLKSENFVLVEIEDKNISSEETISAKNVRILELK
jgi:hypothetical protein